MEVAGRNDDHLGNEHLLLALLRDPTTPVAQIFSRLGFTYDTAVAQLKLVFVKHA
ncbi:MAG: Clp protease N-terminal domain-containing protein [Gemmatimonadaceae bacterium]